MPGVSRPLCCSSVSRWAASWLRPGAISRMNRRMNAAEIATEMRISASTASSDLDVHDLSDPQESDDLEYYGRQQHELAEGVGEQKADVRRVQAVDCPTDRDRQD